MGWINVILALPEIIRAFIALISFAKGVEKSIDNSKVDKVAQEVKDAKSEGDFRKAADDLSQLGGG